MAEARLPAAPLAATINDPRQMSVARSGENLARKAPPGPATTCRAATRLVASLTVIVTRSREAKPLPTTVRGARDEILKAGARRVGEAVATVATAAASTIGVVTLIHIGVTISGLLFLFHRGVGGLAPQAGGVTRSHFD